MAETPLKVWLDQEERLLRLRLARPKANLIDAAMIAALDQALTAHQSGPRLRGILLDAEGPHFSFGASVEEHLPEQCAAMLGSLHRLIVKLLESPVPILAAVRGQCLGGGLEVACTASRIFAAPDAKFGQPEIKLGVFAPAASCLLPVRIGQANAEDLLFSGRSIAAPDAARAGLVQVVDEDPERAALRWFEEHLSPLSASSLRHAVRAARLGEVDRVKQQLARVERLYIDELMASADALEGLTAFVQKRAANWEN
jgi:cyclohexa-1,5-dienecarbonyl-CoA hydratase